MTIGPNRDLPERRESALAELRERADEIREAVRLRVLTAGNLRHAAASANETPEDVAQAVFLKLWAVVREGGSRGEPIYDLKAYAKRMADNHVASLARRPILSKTDPVEPAQVERLTGEIAVGAAPESVVEHRLSRAEVDVILRELSPKQELLLNMRIELGMTVPEMARVLGDTPKSCEKQLERAIEKVRRHLADAEDLDARDRRRLSRVMAVKRWGTPALVERLRRDMGADLRLASLWRRSNGALHDVAGAVAVDDSLGRVSGGPTLAERALGALDRARDAAVAAVGKTGPEHEVAAGTVAGGAGAGAAKAMVAVCLVGTAATGACVATGVVDIPDHRAGKAVAQSTTPVTTGPAAPTTTTQNEPAAQPPPEAPAPTDAPPPSQSEKPVERVNQELGLASPSASGSSSSAGSRDFAAPAGASSSGGGSGGGGSGGGGGTGGSRENFGP